MKLKSYLNDTDENITKEVKHVHHQHRTQYKKRERERIIWNNKKSTTSITEHAKHNKISTHVTSCKY